MESAFEREAGHHDGITLGNVPDLALLMEEY